MSLKNENKLVQKPAYCILSLIIKGFSMAKLFGIFLLSLASNTAITQELNVMTFNIRLNTAADSMNAWPYRKDNVASQILFHDVHIVGVQEALHDQMTDLQQRLPRYKYKGVGRDDGKEKGEYSAIFYDTTRLQALESKTFWLSERSEERRVGKECRSRWSPCHYKRNNKKNRKDNDID